MCHPCRRERRTSGVASACSRCGATFVATTDRKSCSDECRQALMAAARQPRRKTRSCEVCEQSYRWTCRRQRTCGRRCGLELKRRTTRSQACGTCFRVFVTTAAGGVARFCSESCKPSAARLVVEVPDRDCGECGRRFARANAKYCSNVCSRLAQRRRDLVRSGRTPEAVDTCDRCSQPKPVRTGSRGGGSKYCDPCGEDARRESMQRCRRRRKARLRSVEHEDYTLGEIAQRDGYRCGICHKAVPMGLKVPARRAPTIDHIIPIARGGHDVRPNVRLAHFICNSIRGAGDEGEAVQLLLVG